MKKILTLALALMMAISLVACGTTNSATTNSDTNSTQQEQQSATPGKSATETTSEGQAQPGSATKKILVAYFSRQGNTRKIDNIDTVSGASFPSGNTREIATQIHENVGGDIFEIVTVDPYSTNYDEVVDLAKQEQEDDYRPKLATKVENMDSYDVIFLGYPNWWATIPMAVFTFLEEYNFSGKTIIPFCTHEGSALGRSVTDIKKLCPKSTVLDGLAIRGGNVKNAQNEVSEWLRKIGIIENK